MPFGMFAQSIAKFLHKEKPQVRPSILDDDGIGIRRFYYEDGKFNVTLAGEAVSNLTVLIAEWFRGTPEAVNYAVFDISSKLGDRFEITILKAHGKTPHDLKCEAEKKVAELADELEKTRQALKDALEKKDGTTGGTSIDP